VRHGERVDEVNRAWSNLHPEFSHWDPPLTDEGIHPKKIRNKCLLVF
jgi:hypothetical protein